MKDNKVFIVGAYGQLGNALRPFFPDATYVDRDAFDMTDESAYEKIDWKEYDTIINAAAMTNVDGAEVSGGRELAWNINASAVALLSETANQHDLTLVHVSSDYVFDGTKSPHTESELFAPLSTYGASKAAGDIATSLAKKHYIVRTTWVIGKGKNFVRTMWELANKGVKPSVVNDQIGRLTFADDLAATISHLLSKKPEYGTYNMTNEGPNAPWSDYAKMVFKAAGKSAEDVTGISTEEYFAGKENIAPRPLRSEMDLSKLTTTGFVPRELQVALDEYLEELKKESK